MKKLLWFFVGVLFFSSLSLAAEEDYSLKYREQHGPVRYRTEMTFQFSFHLPKEARMRPIEGRMVFRYDSTELWTTAGESAVRCYSTVDKIEVESEFFNQKQVTEEDNLPPDQAVEIILSPQGEVIDIVLPAVLMEADETAKADETGTAQNMPDPASQEQMLVITKMIYNLFYHYLPKYPVKKGENWEITHVLPRLSQESENPKLLSVTYELSKVQKSRGKRYATLVTSGQTVFDTVIDPKAFTNKNLDDPDAEAEQEEGSEDEQEAQLLSTLNKIAVIFPMEWKGKIIFGIDDGLLKERELVLKGDGRIEFISHLEKIPMRMTFEAKIKMKQL